MEEFIFGSTFHSIQKQPNRLYCFFSQFHNDWTLVVCIAINFHYSLQLDINLYKKLQERAALVQEATGFSIHYNNKVNMRSKERKSYRNSQEHIQAPRSPNPHLKKQPSFDKTQTTRINKPPLPPHPVSPNPKQANISIDQLLKENSELRKEIVQLKVHQFYQFDDLKLKELINQLQSLRKQINLYKEEVKNLQLQNDFLLRTNQQLKIELQKEICLRTKDNYSQENSKYMFKNMSKCEEENAQVNSQTACIQETTLQETLEIGRQDSLSRRCKQRTKEKYHSPRRNKESILESANQYLLYRRNKQKKPSSEKLITS